MCVCYPQDPESKLALGLSEGWTLAWTSTWSVGRNQVVRPVREIDGFPLTSVRPMRRFSYATAQHHRPGLEYVVSTGGMHGGESMKEHRVLLALDFAGEVQQVLSQPFRLTFCAEGRVREHIPDYLAVTRFGRWLIDVRPGELIEQDDRIAFAATAEVALAIGWLYTVVAGWLPQVFTTLDDLSQHRRECGDVLGLRPSLLSAAADGPLSYGDLVGGTPLSAVARAQAIRLLWLRQLAVDLSEPLTDRAVVWLAGEPPR